MVNSYYHGQTQTISQLASKILVTRQAISALVKECEAEQYIIVSREAGAVRCTALEILVEGYEDYCKWKKSLLLKEEYSMLNQIGNVNNIITKL